MRARSLAEISDPLDRLDRSVRAGRHIRSSLDQIGTSTRSGGGGADQEVGHQIAGRIAGGGDRGTQCITDLIAIDSGARKCRQHCAGSRRESARSTDVVDRSAVGIAHRRANDEVVDRVAIHVADAGRQRAGQILRIPENRRRDRIDRAPITTEGRQIQDYMHGTRGRRTHTRRTHQCFRAAVAIHIAHVGYDCTDHVMDIVTIENDVGMRQRIEWIPSGDVVAEYDVGCATGLGACCA